VRTLDNPAGFACLVVVGKLKCESDDLIARNWLHPTQVESNHYMKNSIWKAVVEVGFIIFLFYSNLLMGEMERTARGREKGLLWDLHDIFTRGNLLVAVVAGLIGYLVVERLRGGGRRTRRKE
jgi:hypothetical protein